MPTLRFSACLATLAMACSGSAAAQTGASETDCFLPKASTEVASTLSGELGGAFPAVARIMAKVGLSAERKAKEVEALPTDVYRFLAWKYAACVAMKDGVLSRGEYVAFVKQILPTMRTKEVAGAAVDSAAKPLTEAELANLSAAQLELIRNEIFARRGWVFRRADLQAYFEKFPWYAPKRDNDAVARSLTDAEKQNVETLLRHEKQARRVSVQESAPAADGSPVEFRAVAETPFDGFLALKAEPRLSSARLAKIDHGATVAVGERGPRDVVDGLTGNWFRVSHRGMTGWAWGWYLRRVD